MSSATPVRPLADAPAVRSWSTPRWLAVLGAAIVLLVTALTLLVAASAGAARDGFDVIDQQAAPQVRTTTDLYFALSDMDARAAAALLVGTAPDLDTLRQYALTVYEERRQQADHDLAVLGGDGSLLDRLGSYESLTAQAFLINVQGNDPIAGPSAAVLSLYRQATDTMHGILADVRTLTDHENAMLNSVYTDRRASVGTIDIWVRLVGAATVVVLLVTQFVLYRRQRRRINLALLAATLLTLLLATISVNALAGAMGQLTAAKSDAFDSIVTLSEARAVSYAANADESRYLLDPQRASRYQQAFLDESQSVLTVPAASLADYEPAVFDAMDAYHNNQAVIAFGGDLGTEMRNITFPGERAAAERTLAAYQSYQVDDQTLRGMVTGAEADPAATVAFDVGTTQSDPDYDFAAYDEALGSLIQINQLAFDVAVHNGQSDISPWTVPLPVGGAVLVLLLAAVGIGPRIAEYR